MKKFVSYAQNKEDLILHTFFPDVKEGFYVDVGAYDPVIDSVTKFFYDKGWRGINIEPNKHSTSVFNKKRPRDTNLNIGISNTNQKMLFREYKDKGHSTFSLGMAEERDRGIKKTDHSEYEVETKTLASVLEQYASKKVINFLKVDVEGLEYEVLLGNNWEKYRPEVICIEAIHRKNDWRPILKKNKYQLVYFDGLNEYYAASEKKDRIAAFSAERIFESPPLRYADYKKMQHLNRLINEQKREINKLAGEVSELKKQKADLQVKVDNLLGVKNSIKSVLRESSKYIRYRRTALKGRRAGDHK